MIDVVGGGDAGLRKQVRRASDSQSAASTTTERPRAHQADLATEKVRLEICQPTPANKSSTVAVQHIQSFKRKYLNGLSTSLIGPNSSDLVPMRSTWARLSKWW